MLKNMKWNGLERTSLLGTLGIWDSGWRLIRLADILAANCSEYGDAKEHRQIQDEPGLQT